jgi:hypothetical protein
MKFDTLYKILVNEAEMIEDMAELEEVPSLEETPVEQRPQTEDEMIDYLVQNSPLISRGKGGVELSPTEKVKKAKNAIDNGFFDVLYDGIQEKKAAVQSAAIEPEAEALDVLPQELEDTNPTDEDIADIAPALQSHRKLRQREQEDQEEYGID